MSTIDAEGVWRVASLTWTAFTEDETTKITADLGIISNAVVKVSEIATPDAPAISHLVPLTNVWRGDVMGPTLNHDEVLVRTPHPEVGMFGIP